MSHFYCILAVAIAVPVAALTISAVAQPSPTSSPVTAMSPAQPLLPKPSTFFAAWGALQSSTPLPPIPPAPDVAGGPFLHLLFGAGPPPLSPPWMPGQLGGEGLTADEMCFDKRARQAAARAYVKTHLNLNAEQLGLWRYFENAAHESEADERRACSGLAVSPILAENMETVEGMLVRRLALMRKDASLRKVIGALSSDQLRLMDYYMPSTAP